MAMQEDERIRVLLGVSDTFFDYAEAADEGDIPRFVSLFTEDCTFDSDTSAPGRRRIEGRARTLLGAFVETSHHISSVRVRSVDDGVAHATAYVYAVHRKHDGEMFEAWGRYDCRLRADEGRWRFCRHRIVISVMRGSDGREAAYTRLERADLSVTSPSPT